MQGGRGEEEVSMKEVATQLVTVVAPLTEFVQGLQRQRIAAAQRQQAPMAVGAPMIRPAVAGAVPPLRCYNCNQPGHLTKDCPKPRTQGGPTGPSQIPLAAPTAAGQERVATVMDTRTTEMVTPAATEIGPDEYMAATMFEPGTIGVIRHVQRITEESDLGPWRPGFEDIAVPGPEYKDGHIDVLDALKALDLRIPVPIPYLLTISEAANEKLIERCLKNRRRFEESRKGKKSVLRDPPTNEESQPSTSEVHEANRIGMIQTVDSASGKPEVFLRAYPITWKSVECDCEVWGSPLAAILDSGSSAVAISWRLTKQLGREGQVQPLRPDELYISATEDSIHCKGRITNVPIRVGRVHCLCDVIVLDVQAYDVLLGIPWQAVVGARMHFDSCKVVLTSAHPKPQAIPMRLAVRMRTQPAPRLTTKAHQINMIRRLSPDENEPSTETNETDVPDRYPIRVQDRWRHSWRREPLEIVRSEFNRSHAFSSVVQGEPLLRALKEALTSAPVLARPDPTRPLTLYTDWQPQAISTALTQHGEDGREHVIEYASKTLSQAQANYEVCKGECLAVVWGIQHFRPYLYGQKFVLVTDHQPLLSLRNNADYTGTLGRWAVCLQDYDFDIRHRATRQHGNVDGLTRLLPPNKCPANERLIPWRPEVAATKPHYGELHVLRRRMNHRQPEHEPLEHFQTPLVDRLLRHQFNEERQLRYDIQQVNVPAPGVADLVVYSLLCDRLTYAGVYVDVTQLLGRETTRVFIEFRALQVAPNFVHNVATFIGDLTILPQPNREPARNFVCEYALTDVEPLPFADEDAWELHRALYKWVAMGMFRFFVDHEDHTIGEHFIVYYVITRPKPAEKEGTVALYPFAQLQAIDPGLLELIHLELLSIAQVIASEEEEIQPRLRTVTAPRRTYNAVVIPDYIAQRAERLEDFPKERPLGPPSLYSRPAPPKAPKKMPKRKRRHPSQGAQGSRIDGGEEVIQPARTRIPDPVPRSAVSLVKETIVPSLPIPRVPDLNLDGAGPSSSAAAGGGSRSDRGGLHGGDRHHQARGHRGGAAP
ncbi:hypothetical protein CBR_g29707 [Chara braunii]|uniref:CCHC-type domain-containing protein n=1 Tax=Chara braunii TaxID=69332 RepID=A0A388LB64_CHABU|nr:hypothetical protein CBR_g29707 [Chara braunii]|eukprot:GBG79560.1 hypothetical protein CBR_g29707 [Chara braunii]